MRDPPTRTSPSQPSPRIPPPLPGEFPTELQKMIRAENYLATDPYLSRLRDLAVVKNDQCNLELEGGKRMKMYKEWVNCGGNCWIMRNFTCEYGFNISLGDDTYIGPNCTFIDVCPIMIGTRTMIGADVKLYTPTHPLSPEARNGLSGPEAAKPITIGTDCWLCGGCTILPGMTIGNGSTVGAGAIVTHDVPDRVVVVGNPARIIQRIKEDGTVEPVPNA